MVGVRQFDEARLLETALALFWRKGFQGTSMLDLARASGVQRNSLYNAYGGKEVLFLQAFDHYAKRLMAGVRAAFAEADPAKALTAFFDLGIATMAASAPDGCFTTRTATEAEIPDSAIQARLRLLLDEMETVAGEALARSAGSGRLVHDPETTARIAVTFSRGLAVMERVHHDPARLRASAAALVQVLVRDPQAHP
ncbi:MAG: helix-turn-helix domain containing protein [Zavarzinia sp.]|nr:helix-turn-helix domain containing protein [Zavarzinia sp.]